MQPQEMTPLTGEEAGKASCSTSERGCCQSDGKYVEHGVSIERCPRQDPKGENGRKEGADDTYRESWPDAEPWAERSSRERHLPRIGRRQVSWHVFESV